MAEHRFAQFASADPDPAADATLAFWDQRVFFDGTPARRREVVAHLAATPGMTERAARLLLETAATAGGEKVEMSRMRHPRLFWNG